jgi:Predicted transcriptional regulators
MGRDGLVSHPVHPVVPARVDYYLTPMGRTLLSTITELIIWADEHTDEIDSAPLAYDARGTGWPSG